MVNIGFHRNPMNDLNRFNKRFIHVTDYSKKFKKIKKLFFEFIFGKFVKKRGCFL
jgi:hypothetical protein